MAIDTVRLLTESAAQIWQRLSPYGSIEALPSQEGFDAWLQLAQPRPSLDHTEEQALRRDYRRLCEILTEIEALVRSRPRALELVLNHQNELAPLSPTSACVCCKPILSLNEPSKAA